MQLAGRHASFIYILSLVEKSFVPPYRLELVIEWAALLGARGLCNGNPGSVHRCTDASPENPPHYCRWITDCNRSYRSLGAGRKASFEQCKFYLFLLFFICPYKSANGDSNQ
jgi:hypothetical protein